MVKRGIPALPFIESRLDLTKSARDPGLEHQEIALKPKVMLGPLQGPQSAPITMCPYHLQLACMRGERSSSTGGRKQSLGRAGQPWTASPCLLQSSH